MLAASGLGALGTGLTHSITVMIHSIIRLHENGENRYRAEEDLFKNSDPESRSVFFLSKVHFLKISGESFSNRNCVPSSLDSRKKQNTENSE